MDLFSPLFFNGLLIGVSLGLLFNYWYFKKKIEKIGNIKCERCGYQGKPSQSGFRTKIVCPDCTSERWIKI